MHLRAAITAVIFLSFVGFASADPAAVGLSGLGEMRTPATLREGRSEIYLHTRFTSVNDEIGSRLSPALGLNYGITKGMEAGTQVPFRSVDGQSGLGNIPLLYKYRFYESDLLNFAGTAFVGLPTSSKDNEMGTGSLGFAVEADGSLSFGALELLGAMNYGKNDYCIRCEYPGFQREPEIVNVPVVNLAGGASYGDKDYTAYGELHFTNVANGVQNGQLDGDPDLFLLLGGRYRISEDFGIGGYAGAGLSGASSNTKALVNVLASYAFGAGAGEPEIGEEAPATAAPRLPAGQAAPRTMPVPVPQAFVDVVDACQAPEFTKKFMDNLAGKKIKAKLAGAAKKMDQSAIYFTDAGVEVGSEVARFMSGKQKMYKQASIPGGAVARVFLGCDIAAPAPPAAPPAPPAPVAAPAGPLPPKKPIESINVAVINGCGKPGLAEDAAKTLLLNSYNVTKIYDEPTPTTPGITEIRYRAEYKDESADIAAKLPGQQRLFVDKALAEDTDIQVMVGCQQ